MKGILWFVSLLVCLGLFSFKAVAFSDKEIELKKGPVILTPQEPAEMAFLKKYSPVIKNNLTSLHNYGYICSQVAASIPIGRDSEINSDNYDAKVASIKVINLNSTPLSRTYRPRKKERHLFSIPNNISVINPVFHQSTNIFLPSGTYSPEDIERRYFEGLLMGNPQGNNGTLPLRGGTLKVITMKINIECAAIPSKDLPASNEYAIALFDHADKIISGRSGEMIIYPFIIKGKPVIDQLRLSLLNEDGAVVISLPVNDDNSYIIKNIGDQNHYTVEIIGHNLDSIAKVSTYRAIEPVSNDRWYNHTYSEPLSAASNTRIVAPLRNSLDQGLFRYRISFDGDPKLPIAMRPEHIDFAILHQPDWFHQQQCRSTNGCSVPLEGRIPGDWFAAGAVERYNYTFKSSCNQHDKCYHSYWATYRANGETQRQARLRCDREWNERMKSVCNSTLMSILSLASVGAISAECALMRNIYYEAVRSEGKDSFRTSSSSYCEYDSSKTPTRKKNFLSKWKKRFLSEYTESGKLKEEVIP